MECYTCCSMREERTGENKKIMKICLQFFKSTKQLRVSIFSVKNLTTDNRRVVVKVSLAFKSTDVQKCCTNKAYTYMSTAKFNENLYFNANKDLNDYCLRIRLYDVPTERCDKCSKRSILVGEEMLSLRDLNLNFDTSIEMQLSNPIIDQVMLPGELKISRTETIEEQLQKLRRRFKQNMSIRDLNRLIRFGFF